MNLKRKRKSYEEELEDLKSENRKLVQQIRDIFHILREEFLISKDELPELLELLDKHKS